MSNGNENNRGYFSADRVTVIEPTAGWRLPDVGELWAYRELLWVLGLRDIKIRYKQTVLGIGWALIQPIMTMIIFSIIFGRLAQIPSEGFPYPIFVYAGLLPWMFFANSVNASSVSIVGSSQLVSKVYFPRLIIPMSSIGAGLVDFAVASTVLLMMMWYYGISWSVNLMFAPVLTLGVMFAAVGVGTWLSAVTVAYRDFRYVIPFLVQIWMFVSPVIYPPSIVSDNWRWVLFLNPLTGLIDGFRAAFLGKPIDFVSMATALAVSLIIFLFGLIYFGKVERRFADII